MKKIEYEYCIESTIGVSCLKELEDALSKRAKDGQWELIGFESISINRLHYHKVNMILPVFKRIKKIK